MHGVLPRVGVLVVAAIVAGWPAASAAVGPCDAPANEIVAENCLPGSPPGEWAILGAGDSGIQGFATDISVDQGQTVEFKINADAGYELDIYRLGYYGGAGARRIGPASEVSGPQAQPECTTENATGLVDCGGWAVSARWSVPASATSGIYLAVAKRNNSPLSHIVFVVRDDDGGSDLLFQTSDTTWQAYNRYGGNSLYTGSPVGRAYKVSYNRPFSTANYLTEDWLFNTEYPMVRWLERNGYDLSYFTGVDSDRRGAEIREHRTFLSVGHDEYWSGAQRAQVESARDAGVHLAFFSGNEVFWKTRWEDGHRTLVCYKETHPNGDPDPSPLWTGTWRDSRPINAEGAQPENGLTGTAFRVATGTLAIEVPAADGRLRFWRGTSVAEQAPGATASLTASTLGYEWDEDADNGARPAGLVRLSSTTAEDVYVLQDHGSSYGNGTATHHLTLYRDTNGAGPDALVFGAGTIQWSWGLDDVHDRGNPAPSPAMQQATANLFADMGVQPASLQADLQAATPSTDFTGPSAAIDGPATIAVTAGTPRTIQGTAADAGGGRVGAVEVSVDAGASWHPANGRETWSYTWTPAAGGAVTPLVRAADDSGNLTGAVPPAPPGDAGSGMPATRSQGAAAPAKGRAQVGLLALGPRRARMSRKGVVRLRVACPAGASGCRVRLRLRIKGRRVAAKTLTIEGDDARNVALELNRAARRRLVRRGSLRATVVASSGGRTTRKSIRLLAPRSRSLGKS